MLRRDNGSRYRALRNGLASIASNPKSGYRMPLPHVRTLRRFNRLLFISRGERNRVADFCGPDPHANPPIPPSGAATQEKGALNQ
jgi:hypothetical protein